MASIGLRSHLTAILITTLSSLTLTACGSDMPDSAKVFRKALEQRADELKAHNSDTNTIANPFGFLPYMDKVSEQTASNLRESESRGQSIEGARRDTSYFKSENGEIFESTIYWPIQRAIKLTKKMKQQDCSKEITDSGIRYECFVTVENVLDVMPDFKDSFSDTEAFEYYKQNFNTLKGKITLRKNGDKLEFISFKKG
jgi:hypothetical protein